MATLHSHNETRIRRSPGTVRVATAPLIVLFTLITVVFVILVNEVLTTLLLIAVLTREGNLGRCRRRGGTWAGG